MGTDTAENGAALADAGLAWSGVPAETRRTAGRTLRAATAPEVRPAFPEDAARICRFLASRKLPADTWRALFEHSWSRPVAGSDPVIGYVLVDCAAKEGDRIVGFLAVIGAERRLNRRIGRICNLGVWSVMPEYRAWSLMLFLAATRDRDVTYTDLTATPAVRRVLARLGFRPLDEVKLVMPPLLHARTLRAGDAWIEADPACVRALLDEEDRRVFDDHAPYPCLQLALVEGRRHAHLVLKRRVKRWVAFSELLRCSDPGLLLRHLERVKLAVLRRHRALALVADARLLGGARPAGLRIARPALFRSSMFSAAEIDNLYSEFVLLPI